MKKHPIVSTITFCLVIACAGLYFFPSASNANPNGKIVPNHTSVTVTEGNTQVIQVQLSQPIICPSNTTVPPTLDESAIDETLVPLDACEVDIPLTISDPSRVSTNVSTLTWSTNEWSIPRSFTITVNHDGVDNPDNVVTITGTAITNSPYYSNEGISITVNINDPDHVTTTTSASTTTTTSSSTTVATTTTPVDSPSVSLSDSTVAPGSTTTVHGSGFQPDSDATVTLHSTPTVLGTVHINSVGTFTQAFTIPKNVVQGSHEIVVDGIDASGNSVSSVHALTVLQLPQTGTNSRAALWWAFDLMVIGVGALGASRPLRRRSLLH